MRPAYFTPTDEGLVPGETARSWWVPGMIHGRLLGGLLYLGGMVIMLWNTIKTATAGRVVPVQIPAVAAHA